MKLNVFRASLTFILVMGSTLVFSQIDTIKNSQAVSGAVTSENKATFLDSVIMILIFCGVLFMIGHMLYVLFKSKRFNQNYSIIGFKTIRQEAGKPEMSTDEENNQCIDLLNDAFFIWSDVEVDKGDEYRKPRRMKEILRSAILIQEVIDIAPTDSEIIDKLNEYKEVIRSNERRSFDGSKALIILGLVFAIIVGLISKSEQTGFILSTLKNGAFFWVPVIVYYVSSLTPQFLIDKRANRGGGNVSTGLVAIALGILGSGVTMRTKFSDGSYEDDHSGHYIAWILGIIALVAVAITIFFWSVLNYVRNYVLFF